MQTAPRKDDKKSAFAVFVRKLFQSHPELEVLNAFLPEPRREAFIAYQSLVFELEQAFSIRESSVAANKIHWWGEELSRAIAGQAQHPITQRLSELSCINPQSASVWRALASGALVQVDFGKPQDLAAQLFQLERFYVPVAQLELEIMTDSRAVALNNSTSGAVTGMARLLSAAQLMWKLVHWLPARTIESSPIPLNLLARHQKTYSDLMQPVFDWVQVLHDHLDVLSVEIECGLKNAEGLDLPCRYQARLNLVEIRRLRRSANPERLIAKSRRLIGWLWLCHAWREARVAI